MNNKPLNSGEQAFRSLSVTRQIALIQAAFSEAVQESSPDMQSMRKLQILLTYAESAVIERQPKAQYRDSRAFMLYYRWVRLLNHKNQYRVHLRFMQTFLQAFHTTRKKQPILELTLYPYSALMKYQYQNGLLKLQLQETVVRMKEPQIQALASAISAKNSPEISKILNRFIKSTDADALSDYFSDNLPRRAETTKARGAIFNLEEVFERVNREFFDGKMPKPALKWSAQPNKRRMGTYNYKTDTVMINKALDKRKTPQEVIDFVMYHELLHKALGYKTSQSGRRQAHTSEFRKYEKSFPNYEEIERYLNHL